MKLSVGVACGICKQRYPSANVFLQDAAEVGLLGLFLHALLSTCANPYITATCGFIEKAALTSLLSIDIVNDWLQFCFLRKFGTV